MGMTNDEKIRRKHEAERILNNALIKEAFDGLEREFFNTFRQSKRSEEELLRLWHSCQTLNSVKELLESAIKTGIVAENDVERELNKQKREAARRESAR